MSKFTVAEAISGIQRINEEKTHLGRAASIIHWDEATNPKNSEKGVSTRMQTLGFLSKEVFKRTISQEMVDYLGAIEGHDAELNDKELAMYKKIKRIYEKTKSIPPEFVQEFTALTGEADTVWQKAKNNNDYAIMEPYFEKIFDFSRKMTVFYGYSEGTDSKFVHPYDALLDDYEEGMTVELLDKFFGNLRTEIVDLLKKVTAKKQPDAAFLEHNFDISKQEILADALAALVGYDHSCGQIGKTEHPFMTSPAMDDVRIAMKYIENDISSGIYSIVHESGHALYEQRMNKELCAYNLDGGASFGIHESQSRLFENCFARSREFMTVLMPVLRTLYPKEFTNVTEEQMYKAVNIAKPSLIRTEADELTYCLHICVRYDLEKAVIENKISVADLPNAWKEKMTEYLGIAPEDYKTGVLQDTHWPSGSIGYFPSYAIGSVFAAQLLHYMKKDIDVDSSIKKGDFNGINLWLDEKIRKYGEMLSPTELIKLSTGEELNSIYYVNYLKDKFTDIYEL